MDLSIVIPCYNEQAGVPRLRRDLLPVVAELAATRAVEVVLVDDGSQDGTWPALQLAFGSLRLPQIRFRPERHAVNRGLGAALRTGFAASSGDIVITADSDGTYDWTLLPSLLACLTPGVDLVTASPYHPDGGVAGVPAYRLLFSRGSSLLYRLLVDWRLHTYTSLLRAYRRPVIDEIAFESDGFLAGTELMVKAMLSGYRAAECPAVLRSRAAGVSKARLARTTWAHLRFLGQVGLWRLETAARRQRRGGQTWSPSRLSSAGENRK
jgi:dolichol-phosphate mannosyltransferase